MQSELAPVMSEIKTPVSRVDRVSFRDDRDHDDSSSSISRTLISAMVRRQAEPLIHLADRCRCL